MSSHHDMENINFAVKNHDPINKDSSRNHPQDQYSGNAAGSSGIFETRGPEGPEPREDEDANLNTHGFQLSNRYISKEIADDMRSNDVRSERTHLQRRDLDIFDVAALIINKQIGTGIFTTPGLVLSLTGSKTTSIIMWFCGGIWALLRLVLPHLSSSWFLHSV
jgi:hypothetical protein